jgi:hypothetical protein
MEKDYVLCSPSLENDIQEPTGSFANTPIPATYVVFDIGESFDNPPIALHGRKTHSGVLKAFTVDKEGIELELCFQIDKALEVMLQANQYVENVQFVNETQLGNTTNAIYNTFKVKAKRMQDIENDLCVLIISLVK